MIQNKKLKSVNLNFKVTSISMLPDEKCKEDYGNKYRKGSSFCAGNRFFFNYTCYDLGNTSLIHYFLIHIFFNSDFSILRFNTKLV